MISESEHILIVEDTEADFVKIKRSLKKARLANPIIHIDHGDDALHYLLRTGKYQQDDTWIQPAIVLLDINLPGASGIEILKAVKNTEGIKRVPIIMLTTSDSQEDIDICYENGANSYITKPFSSEGFFEAMGKIREFWFTLNVYPTREDK